MLITLRGQRFKKKKKGPKGFLRDSKVYVRPDYLTL